MAQEASVVPHPVEKDEPRGKKLWFLAAISPDVRGRIMYVLVCFVCLCMFEQVNLCSCTLVWRVCPHTQLRFGNP